MLNSVVLIKQIGTAENFSGNLKLWLPIYDKARKGTISFYRMCKNKGNTMTVMN